jgi:hypothetical protein
MGEFKKATDEAKALFSELAAGMDGERKPMFGCPCLFLHGNMICGAFADRIFFRVPRDLQAAVNHRTAIAEQLAASWVRAQTLPPKVKKGKKGA